MNGKLKPKMIVTDLDGTLLKNDKTISDYTKAVLDKIYGNILFVVATARPIRAVKNYLPFLKYDIGIYHGGAVIIDKNENKEKNCIKNVLEIIKILHEANNDIEIALEIDEKLFANFDAGILWPGIEFNNLADILCGENLEADKIIIKNNTTIDIESLKKVLPADLNIINSEDSIFMIMNKTATKWNAVKKIAEKYGIQESEIIAFGDDFSDIEMIKNAGIGVAVSNSIDEVKNVADCITVSNEEDGVARFLDKLL